MTPVRLCLEPGCPEHAHYRGRCPIHSKDENRRQHSSPGRIYGQRRWKMLRRRRLHLNPLCVECGAIATEVDHIHPIEDGGPAFELDNTQSLCKHCHSSKTNAEVRARMRQ